ncbi:retrovirus-related Pol polyprotein from transposon 297 [Trichonephila clavipes]|nr:retrovirus-related Pol polyprotein from transposon 297 [Trichonephila clavipes]
MKSLVFETPVNSAEELVARISAAAGEIRNTPEMLSNVRRSMKRRCEACITCGGHASNYALGAVLLQGEGSDEHPIEYASRLLTPAERNYSTTEREALAVVWALKKFRGYIEGTEITVASDHQPLKWLLNLKSPTGRLARWALEIQSFNLKVQYIPGKANVVADMLSRPVTQEEESFLRRK